MPPEDELHSIAAHILNDIEDRNVMHRGRLPLLHLLYVRQQRQERLQGAVNPDGQLDGLVTTHC